MSELDTTYIEHGSRVAYYVYKLASYEGKTEKEINSLIFAAYFHDVGAYTTNEMPNLLTIEPKGTYAHSLSGYLFLKYFSPLGDFSKVILYHHALWKNRVEDSYFGGGELIHIADRVDVLVELGKSKDEIINYLELNNDTIFNPKDVDAFVKLFKADAFLEIKQKNYMDYLKRSIQTIAFTKKEAGDYLQMLSSFFEIYNDYTLIHSKVTGIIASEIGYYLGLSEKICQELYVSGLIHDLGKIKTPLTILDKPTSLSFEEMKIMRKYVEETYEITKDFFPKQIVDPAYHHHEREDGSGYPLGLKKDELTIEDSIMAASDCISALMGKRSYKRAFTYQEIVPILGKEVEENKLNERVVSTFLLCHEQIIDNVMEELRKSQKKYKAMEEEKAVLTKQNKWCL